MIGGRSALGAEPKGRSWGGPRRNGAGMQPTAPKVTGSAHFSAWPHTQPELLLVGIGGERWGRERARLKICSRLCRPAFCELTRTSCEGASLREIVSRFAT